MTAKQGQEKVIPFRPAKGNISDEALLRDLQANRAGAFHEFYERYADHVRRVITRVLGIDPELPDLISEVFLQGLKSIDSVRDGASLKAWITRVAVFTARKCIRSRKRKKWLRFTPTEELPTEHLVTELDDDQVETFRAVRCVLDKMPVDERIVFALRFEQEMEMGELADACNISLSTAKRRVAVSERTFKKLAADYEVLHERLGLSEKWRRR